MCFPLENNIPFIVAREKKVWSLLVDALRFLTSSPAPISMFTSECLACFFPSEVASSYRGCFVSRRLLLLGRRPGWQRGGDRGGAGQRGGQHGGAAPHVRRLQLPRQRDRQGPGPQSVGVCHAQQLLVRRAGNHGREDGSPQALRVLGVQARGCRRTLRPARDDALLTGENVFPAPLSPLPPAAAGRIKKKTNKTTQPTKRIFFFFPPTASKIINCPSLYRHC